MRECWAALADTKAPGLFKDFNNATSRPFEFSPLGPLVLRFLIGA